METSCDMCGTVLHGVTIGTLVREGYMTVDGIALYFESKQDNKIIKLTTNYSKSYCVESTLLLLNHGHA